MRSLLPLVLGLCLAPFVVAASETELSPQEKAEGFVPLFDGKSVEGWEGAVAGYSAKDGLLVCDKQKGGLLYTKQTFADFLLRLDYKLEPGGNNGIGIRTPGTGKGTPATTGMEIQILDDDSPRYAKLDPRQYCGSVYGAIAAKRGHIKPAGQWNSMEILAEGYHIRVKLNGTVVADGQLDKLGSTSMHGREFKGLLNKEGHIALCGHREYIEFRNMRIKKLSSVKGPEPTCDEPSCARP
jgi:hypothetical protein